MKLARALSNENLSVDLLVTLDAANGTKSDEVDRSIPANVKKNINYFQTNAGAVTGIMQKLLKSRGGANTRANGNKSSIIKNIDDAKMSYFGKRMIF